MGTDAVTKFEALFPRQGGAAAGFIAYPPAEASRASNHAAEGVQCFRGLFYALLIELIAAFCVYEVWRFFKG
jgi:hypothetical protein